MSFSQHMMATTSSVWLGIACLMFVRAVFDVCFRPSIRQAEPWDREANRRIKLRSSSTFYRRLEAVIDEMVTFLQLPLIQRYLEPTIRKLNVHLRRGGHRLPLTAEETLALTTLQALLCAPLVLSALWPTLGWLSLVATLGFTCLMYGTVIDGVVKTSNERLDELKSRLPYAIDLMALTMAAGSTFPHSLSVAASENTGHPIGEELERVFNNLTCGKTQQSALEELRNRLNDPDVDEIVLAINNSEQLGAPMSETLLTLAETMRQKRSQRIEAAVERAKTSIVFPGFVLMVACMMVILGPFLLPITKGNPLF